MITQNKIKQIIVQEGWFDKIKALFSNTKVKKSRGDTSKPLEEITADQRSWILAAFPTVDTVIVFGGKNLRAMNIPVYQGRTVANFRNEGGNLHASVSVYADRMGPSSQKTSPVFTFDVEVKGQDDMDQLVTKLKQI